MHSQQDLGYSKNNKHFSDCSLHDISGILKDRAKKCFEVDEGGSCGNFYLNKDMGEECDEGPEGNSGKCCHANCTLMAHAQCSDANEGCCEKCQVVKWNKTCSLAAPGSCHNDSFCNGVTSTCPEPANVNDETPCRWGICLSGVCSSVCAKLNKTPCSCDKVEDSCKWCCLEHDKCLPLDISLPAGAPCVNGRCNNDSQCIFVNPNPFYTVLKYIQETPILIFMRDNIVGIVLFFSTLFWIPVSCALNRMDERKRVQIIGEKESVRRWKDCNNKELISETDRKTMRIRGSMKVFRAASANQTPFSIIEWK